MHELSQSHRRIHAWLERLPAASDSPTSFLQSIFERASDWCVSEARAILFASRIEAGERSAIPGLKNARSVFARAPGEERPKLDWCDRLLGGSGGV